MNTKAYFRRTWTLAEACETLSHRVEELDAVCGRMTAPYDPTGRIGSRTSGAGDGTLASLADLRTAYIEAKQELEQAEREILHVCEALSGRDSLILQYRYVKRCSWLEIRTAMQRKGYASATLRTVYRWHRTALLRAERLLREESV